MLFNSYIFIFAFFPAVILGFYILNRYRRESIAKLFLAAMSLVFYAYFHPIYVFIIVGSICANYLISFLIKNNQKNGRIWMIVGIILDIGVIFFYKYLGFTIKNINMIFHTSIPMLEILMPLGISFFTFQQISFLVDTYHGEIENCTFFEYILFVSFFPQLIAGPIVLEKEMVQQFNDVARKKFDAQYFSKGIYRFSIGLAKKVIIADTLSKPVDFAYANPDLLCGFEGIMVILLYSFQLYFDFSGYCDMACGIAWCLHLDLPENFNSPYLADSISDFWKRWHMSLTRFLTRYVYYPLGGNKKGTSRTLFNVIIVFLISGIWHGADWSFVLWGLLHGIASCFHRLCEKTWNRLLRPVRILLTFLYVSLAWVFFRAESIQEALGIFTSIVRRWDGVRLEFFEQFDMLELTYVESHITPLKDLVKSFPALNLCLIVAIAVLLVFCGKTTYDMKFKPTFSRSVGCAFLLTWSVISMSRVSAFLYFNF